MVKMWLQVIEVEILSMAAAMRTSERAPTRPFTSVRCRAGNAVFPLVYVPMALSSRDIREEPDGFDGQIRR